jgi:glycosyltransferase involved in cell wall biosynthesis
MISVVLPVRNGAQNIHIALESLQNQSSPPTECIVINDGSTDSTGEILRRGHSMWPALRIINTPGVGIANALNLGLSQCRHPWIARMDADDRCHPERLERQLREASADRRRVLLSCKVNHWPQFTPELALSLGEGMNRHIAWANQQVTHEALERAAWIDSPLPHPTWLVHQRALKTVGHYNNAGDLPEDYEWLLRFFEAARTDPQQSLMAHKVDGPPLLDWADHDLRLTRSNKAYASTAFDRVKANALQRRFGNTELDVFIFGLGPKAKALFPFLSTVFETRIRAIVDTNPRHVGIIYKNTPVWSVEQWKHASPEKQPLVLNCVGTPEARSKCEELCHASGLIAGKTFISL